jgi:chromosome segregation ATPase
MTVRSVGKKRLLEIYDRDPEALAEALEQNENGFNVLDAENTRLRGQLDVLRQDNAQVQIQIERIFELKAENARLRAENDAWKKHDRSDAAAWQDGYDSAVREMRDAMNELRTSDHADTTGDTTQTRCAPCEPETSTSGPDRRDSESDDSSKDHGNS